MSTRLRSARAKEQGAVDDLLQNLLQDGAANGVSEAVKTGPGTLADASLAHVDQLLDRVSSRRKKAQERKAAAETSQGGRKRKQQALGDDTLFLQHGSGRALRRRTVNSDEPACGALAQTPHLLEHGNSDTQALNGEDLAIPDALGDGQESREEAGLGSSEGMEVAWNDETRPESRSTLLGGEDFSQLERLELKKDAPNLSQSPVDDVGSRGDGKDGEALLKEHWDWEEGSGHATTAPAGPLKHSNWSGQVAFDTGEEVETEGFGKPRAKPALRRASAKDREFAALVHKAHLLCLLARGVRFDTACDDPLLQASLLSCAPEALGELSNRGDVIQASDLSPLMDWFQEKFRVVENVPSRNGTGVELSGHESDAGRLQAVLEKGTGTAEEIVALFVALCRALGLTTRFISSLDVTPLKPDAASLEASLEWDPGEDFDDSAQLYLRGGAAVAQMLRCTGGLAPPVQTINTSAVPSLMEASKGGKSKAENGVNSKGDIENGSTKDESAKQGNVKERKGKQKGVWSGSAKVLDAKEEVQAKKGKGAQKGKGKQMKEEEGGQGMKMEELTEEEQLAQAIAASLGDGSAPSNGGKSSKVRKSKTELDAGKEAAERRRKGDEEMELQLQMAMAATAIEAALIPSSNAGASSAISRLARGEAVLKSSKASKATDAGAVWSRRRGPALQWGEVYCGGGKEGGCWVHVDPVRGMIDAPGSVEAAAGGKQPLRYVLAFAGGGAKDITRRYVSRWSVIAPLRVDNEWWEETLRPLRRLEAAATSGRPILQSELSSPVKDSSQTPVEQGRSAEPSKAPDTAAAGSSGSGLCGTSGVKAPPKIAVHDQRLKGLLTPPIEDRAAKEDVEMETRILTEPLPTNQQAYKSHHIYALERWLTKYQVLHPKGPILGYCAGQPVYPRTSVQVLHTADRWLREGRKVKRGSLPVKVIQASKLASSSEAAEQVALGEEGEEGATSALFGKWQTDEWRPPPARDGKVPRNERGQVDVWNESFLPAGTVHLRYPRIVPVARRMKVDYAPAMVGFEVKGGRSVPKFDGIVICKEFERDVLDAYLEEEQRAYARELRKREYEAALRWRQLLKAVALRQRLRTTYEHAAPAHPTPQSTKTSTAEKPLEEGLENQRSSEGKKRKQPAVAEDHEHAFPEEDQSYNADTGVRTKRCPCGFSFDVEEM